MKASTRFDVGASPAVAPFELVASDEDEQDARPAYYQPLVLLSALQPPGDRSALLQLASLGYVTLRLYHDPALTPEVACLDPITQTERGAWNVGGVLVSARSSGYTGQQVLRRGRRVATERETLTFDASRQEQARYGAVGTQFEVLYASTFVTDSGATAAAPVHVGGGVFAAAEPVTGGLVVQYRAAFSAFRVWYDLPDHRQYWRTASAGSGVVTRYLPAPEPPPLTVVARAGSAVALVRARREIGRFELADAAHDDDGSAFDGTETDAATQDYRVENPSDPTQFVNVRDYQTITFQDDRGRFLRLRIKDRA